MIQNLRSDVIMPKRSSGVAGILQGVIVAAIGTVALVASLWLACMLYITLMNAGLSFITAISIAILSWFVVFVIAFDLILNYIRKKDS